MHPVVTYYTRTTRWRRRRNLKIYSGVRVDGKSFLFEPSLFIPHYPRLRHLCAKKEMFIGRSAERLAMSKWHIHKWRNGAHGSCICANNFLNLLQSFAISNVSRGLRRKSFLQFLTFRIFLAQFWHCAFYDPFLAACDQKRLNWAVNRLL